MKPKPDTPIKGCFFLEYYPIEKVDEISCYQGTLRVDPRPKIEDGEDVYHVSGDLYRCPEGRGDGFSGTGQGELEPGPRAAVFDLEIAPQLGKARGERFEDQVGTILPTRLPSSSLPNRIPIFPRDLYACYLELAELEISAESPEIFTVDLPVHVYDRKENRFEEPPSLLRFSGRRQDAPLKLEEKHRQNHWHADAIDSLPDLTAYGKAQKKLGVKILENYIGEVSDAAGKVVGFFAMYHVSKSLRRASVNLEVVSHRSLEDFSVWVGKRPYDGVSNAIVIELKNGKVNQIELIGKADEGEQIVKDKAELEGIATERELEAFDSLFLGWDNGKKWLSVDERIPIQDALERILAPPAPIGPEKPEPHSWKTVFGRDDVSWEVEDPSPTVTTSREARQTKENPEGAWTFGELHVAMQASLERRDLADLETRSRGVGGGVHPEAKLDGEWSYHLLSIPRIAGADRGISYDVGDSDLNTTPREGAAIASCYIFPKLEPASRPEFRDIPFVHRRQFWGDVAGEKFSDLPGLYFRTAVHEVGHLMNLGHNTLDTGFMNATNVIAHNLRLRDAARNLSAQRALESELEAINQSRESEKERREHRSNPHDGAQENTLEVIDVIEEELVVQNQEEFSRRRARIAVEAENIEEFPENVDFNFSPEDAERLRHSPDVMVRPGTPFRSDATPIRRHRPPQRTFATGVSLELTPLAESFPLGAPVRLNFRVTNNTVDSSEPRELFVPASFSLKRGYVRGLVTDSNGISRRFSPLIVQDDREYDIQILRPGETRGHSISLLHGDRQALFPVPGRYVVEIEIEWELFGKKSRETGTSSLFIVTQRADVLITPAVNAGHGRAAGSVLTNSDSLIGFALRPTLGEDLLGPSRMLRIALENVELRQHFQIARANQYLESSRYGARLTIEDRRRYLILALNSISENTVLNISEIWRIWQICWEADIGYELLLLSLSDGQKLTGAGNIDAGKGEHSPLSVTGRVVIARQSDGEFDITIFDNAGETHHLERPLEWTLHTKIVGLWDSSKKIPTSERVATIRAVLGTGDAPLPEIRRMNSHQDDTSRGELGRCVVETRERLLKILERHRLNGIVDLSNPEDLDLYNLLIQLPDNSVWELREFLLKKLVESLGSDQGTLAKKLSADRSNTMDEYKALAEYLGIFTKSKENKPQLIERVLVQLSTWI